MRLLVLLLVGLRLLVPGPIQAREIDPPLVIFAASSLTDALQTIAEKWTAISKRKVKLNFDASSRLAQQLAAGAPADVFFSADEEWIHFLEQKKSTLPESRIILASNQLVLIVPTGSKDPPANPSDLSKPSFKRLALAGETVPVGKYARDALLKSNVLESVRKKTINATNARTALQWVAKMEADAGIVFLTDARSEPRVRVAYTFQSDTHSPIQYFGGQVSRGSQKQLASEFLHYCQSDEAQALLKAAGFTPR